MEKTGKKCSKCGNDRYVATISENLKFVWECAECGAIHPFRNTPAKKTKIYDGSNVTPSQFRSIQKIKTSLEKHLPEFWEIKDVSTSPSASNDNIFVEIIVGQKGDEEDLFRIVHRPMKLVCISKGGDIETLETNKKTNGISSLINSFVESITETLK